MFWKVPTKLTGGRALLLLESCWIEEPGATSSELTSSLMRRWILSSSIAAMLLFGAASLSFFAGYGSAHLHKFACRNICRNCIRNIYVENYIKTRQYKTRSPCINLDIHFVNCGHIHCNWTYILTFPHLFWDSDIHIEIWTCNYIDIWTLEPIWQA